VLPFFLDIVAPYGRPVAKILLTLVMSLSIGCHPAAPTASGPLRQRGYLWQRAWGPAVADALTQAETRLDGVVILGAEIVWSGRLPQTIRATIDWEKVKTRRNQSRLRCASHRFLAPSEQMIYRHGTW